jgi:hypothetical protein
VPFPPRIYDSRNHLFGRTRLSVHLTPSRHGPPAHHVA